MPKSTMTGINTTRPKMALMKTPLYRTLTKTGINTTRNKIGLEKKELKVFNPAILKKKKKNKVFELRQRQKP